MRKFLLPSLLLSWTLVGCHSGTTTSDYASQATNASPSSSITTLGATAQNSTDNLDDIFLPSYIYTDLSLPLATKAGNMLHWKVEDNDAYRLENNQLIILNRDKCQKITLTATLENNSSTPVEKSFVITLLPVATTLSEKLNQDTLLLQSALENLNNTLHNNNTYTLPLTGINGSQIEWQSCNKDILTITKDKLSIINPTAIDHKVCAKLEATLILGQCHKKLYFDIKILPDAQTTSGVIIYATAILGNLANADVEISDGTEKSLWQEKTSDGPLLSDIGKFNNHQDALQDGALYLYEVRGGEDWDSNDDGIKDITFTQNHGIIRALIKAEDVRRLGENFRITWLSELLFEIATSNPPRDLRLISDNITKEMADNIMAEWLDEQASLLLKEDINGDGIISALDIYQYNPLHDRSKLTPLLEDKIKDIIDSIHQGGSALDALKILSQKRLYEGETEYLYRYTYTNDHLIATETIYSGYSEDNLQYVDSCRYTYAYNELKILLLKRQKCDSGKERSWRYIYNQDGKVYQELEDTNNDRKTDKITTYHYDSLGNLSGKDIDTNADGTNEIIEVFGNIFDDNGILRQSTRGDFTYYFDPSGHLLSVYMRGSLYESYFWENPFIIHQPE